jgi:hypothetical protein
VQHQILALRTVLPRHVPHTHPLCAKPATTPHMWCHEILYHHFASFPCHGVSSLRNMQIEGLPTSGGKSTTVARSALFASLCPPQSPLYDSHSHSCAHSSRTHSQLSLRHRATTSGRSQCGSISSDWRAAHTTSRTAFPWNITFCAQPARQYNNLCTASIRVQAELFPSQLLCL